MAVVRPTVREIEYPTSPINAAKLKACDTERAVLLDALVVGSAGFMTADAAGRAIMATGYFTEAKATDAFAAGAITTGLVKAGAIAASAGGRALMATGVFDEATATDKFAAGAIVGTLIKNNAITPTQVATVIMGAPTTRAGAGAIPITAPTCLFTSSGVGQALTIADGTYAGQLLTVMHVVRGSGTGTGVITQTTGAKLTAAITTITLATLYASVTLEWSGTLWNPLGVSGATIA